MIKPALTLALLFCTGLSFAQKKQDIVDSLKYQQDANGLISSIFKKKNAADTGNKKHSNWSVLPSAAYNPSVGFAAGVITSGGKTFGNPATTTFSVINAGAYISTAGLSTFEFKNNIFLADNNWNLQGTWQVGKTAAMDNGIGTGLKSQSDGSFSINNLVFDNNADAFPIRYTYIKINERIYRKLSDHIYAGAGFSFNMYDNIDEEKRDMSMQRSHNYRYSVRNGYPFGEYAANGLLFNIQYNSRDQLNRAYKGIYADVVLKVNQKWLGSQHAAQQLKIEFREYWSLSKKNPENVLAFWHWSSYLLGGRLPYLELPGTGSDAYGRIGRGYIIGRFKGLSFIYNEAEWRFPLTRNKLLSAVTFINAETADNQRGTRLFKYWEPGAGAGLRLLFNKYTRSNLCIDYGRGNYGANGLFLGLNEVF
ncbi:hypothetical protein BH09BAC6_BH09BAC6_24490 [soil metagenome]